MSINVTVSGNPIKIHRGKLVTSDVQDTDKRRKMRIQQVRQQSKDLAASVRNNVKKAKNKQQTEFEKQNQSKLKEWQNKKLVQLQTSYEENVKDIGAGHAQARICELEEIQEMERKKFVNEARAARRGQSAQELQQIRRNEENLQKAIPRQTKQLARDIENERAAQLISKMTRKSPKKKRITKGNFTIVEHQDDEPDVPNDEEEAIFQPESQPQIQPQSQPPSQPQTAITLEQSPMEETALTIKSPTKRFRHSDSNISVHTIEVPPDTRISDRIRSRNLLSGRLENIPEVLSTVSSSIIEVREIPATNVENERRTIKTYTKSTQKGISIEPIQPQQEILTCPVCVIHQCPRLHPEHRPQTGNAPSVSNTGNVCAQCQREAYSHPPTCVQTAGNTCNVCPPCQRISHSQSGTQEFEVPRKPTVVLPRDTYTPQYSQHDSHSSKTEYRKVRSFDRNNRFGHHYITDTSQVEHIHPDDLSYCNHDHEQPGPSHRHAKEFSKIADERYKQANMLGKQAMKKEHIRKDYAELMKKLPLLQKEGRIAAMNPAKDKLHKSGARQKEHEQQRQLQMERAFEIMAPTITIPQVPEGRGSSEPKSSATDPPQPSVLKCLAECKAICTTDTSSASKKSHLKQTSNFANVRKSPTKAGKTSEKAAGTWKKPNTDATTTVEMPDDNLLILLERLRAQKEELLKECKDLPQDSNFYDFIENLDFVSGPPNKCNRDKNVQTDCVPVKEVKRAPPKQKEVLILQNTSTQTSPNVVKKSVATSPNNAEHPKSIPDVSQLCDKLKKTSKKPNKKESACTCKTGDKLCEILIKIRDCPKHSTDKKTSDEHIGTEIEICNNQIILDETDNVDGGKQQCGRKTCHLKSGDSDRSISPKRSRSESPQKTSTKQAPRSCKEPAPCKMKQPRPPRMSTSSKHPEEITSSTSYYSPPDYNRQNRSGAPSTSTPYQGAAQGIVLDDRLLTMINRLLEVSKDKLNLVAANVSSISEVPTPNASVINMRTNRPRRTSECASTQNGNHNESTYIEKLSTLLKYFNLSPGDFRSFVSVASASSVVDKSRSTSFGSSGASNCRGNSEKTPHLSLENFTQTSSIAEPIVDQFAQWANICQTRINNLSAMIDQVRKEKQVMISPNGEEMVSINRSNNATIYMNLPPESNSSSSGASSPSLEQKKLNEELLNVNTYDKIHGTCSRSVEDINKLLEYSKNDPNVDRDTIERYLQLVDVELQAQRAKSPEASEIKLPSSPKSPLSGKGVSFEPMLDIPKLPKFQQQAHIAVQSTSHIKSKKPPVSINARRYNEVIHELSAIPEVENSRMSKSPQSKNTSPLKRVTKKSPKKSMQTVTPDESSDSPASERSNETVESMLKNIGLDWAINTLKIMNAANNNSSSSSSSFDIDQKKFSFMLAKNASTSTEKADSPNNHSRHHRTSTPVHTTNSSKSMPGHKLINSGESEISPVIMGGGGSGGSGRRMDYEDNSFHTLPSQSMCNPDHCDI